LLLSGQANAAVTCLGGPECTQTITLKPGWNAIYLQVKPQQDATNEVFADLLDGDGAQIKSIWTWLAHRARIEFIQDPSTDSLISAPGWLRFFPQASEQGFLTNLFSVRANQAYLINLEADANTTLVISGTPVVPKTEWAANSFNLTGFHIDPEQAPTFADYFSASSAHNEQAIYQLIDDRWQPIDPQMSQIETDTAYWVFSTESSDYVGPLQINLPLRESLDFGEVLEQYTPQFKNKTSESLPIEIKLIGGAQGLYYANPDWSVSQSWLAIPPLLTQSIEPQKELRLPLGVKRVDFYLGDFNQTLEVKVPGMSRWLIPVKAIAPQLHSLWVGAVTIDQVSQAQNYQHNCDQSGENANTGGYQLCLDEHGAPFADIGETMAPVSAEFSFRMIMHREGEQVRLLKDVIQMWKKGEGDQPGHLALITDQTLIPEFSGVALRNGETVGKRVSTTAYDFEGDTLDMSGLLGDSLTVTINLPGSAPTNPFRHEYHPDHNNLDINYETLNEEAYTVNRTMELIFLSDNATGTSLGEGYNRLQGTYKETVTGLHKYPIFATGKFILQHTAPTETLNQ